MFEELTRKLEVVLRKMRGQGKLTEKNIADSLREVRRVLLEADVNYKVARDFIASVQQKAVGQEVLRSITPGQQVVKIIYDELTELMGQSAKPISFSEIPPTVIMAVGLQGSGKTAFAGKLALYLKGKGRNPLLVAADIYRPAAVQQLQIVGGEVNTPVFSYNAVDVVKVCLDSIEFSRKKGHDVVIFDTAGRLHIDREMMEELSRIKEATHPQEVLFVADGMTGQDAVRAAEEFLKWVDFTGVVLTKMDGDARGGAALSIRAVTGKPIKFIGIGERPEALELFHPERMASRILGMGDVVSLVERAQKAAEQERIREIEERIRKQDYTLEDFYEQIQQVKRMGPLDQLLGMIPGTSRMDLSRLQVEEKALVKIEAIINSMTPLERRKPHIIDGSRKRRIARGSGTTVQDVNRLLKQFFQMQKMVKKLSRLNLKDLGRGVIP